MIYLALFHIEPVIIIRSEHMKKMPKQRYNSGFSSNKYSFRLRRLLNRCHKSSKINFRHFLMRGFFTWSDVFCRLMSLSGLEKSLACKNQGKFSIKVSCQQVKRTNLVPPKVLNQASGPLVVVQLILTIGKIKFWDGKFTAISWLQKRLH